ncbi:WcbI family polysaccharide biosynthesis putative acetyltransferase [Azospirillum sp.]|uniref:WcbI family polysaccharide biosynthesis putative acetyltransferase n=1 Tax=Azospirillum sp. TaxID=34012 RepID=UPI002611FAE2|nr:WcbI family polysaccharide biosynthesis putative acetyltransferase [Azospirillum sp.]
MSPQPDDGRKLFVLVGTCISFGLQYMLLRSPEFRRAYRLKAYRTHRHQQFMADLAIPDEELVQADVIAFHPPGWADWGNEEAYRSLLRSIPAHVRRISYPYPIFPALWPFHCHDTRNEDAAHEPTPELLPPHYPYGDSWILSKLRKNMSADQILREYLDLDIPSITDVDGLLRKSLEIQQTKEDSTTVKILDFVQENFRTEKTFITMNHVGNFALLHMTNQILNILDIKRLDQTILHTVSELIQFEMPIHPSIIRHFGLRHVGPETRYAIDRFKRQTIQEYVEDYIHFR